MLLLVVLGVLFVAQAVAQQDITVVNTSNIQAEVIAIYKYNGNAMQYIWNVTYGGQVDYPHPSNPNYVLVEFSIKGDGPPSTGTYMYGYDNSDTFYGTNIWSNYNEGYYDAGISELEITPM